MDQKGEISVSASLITFMVFVVEMTMIAVTISLVVASVPMEKKQQDKTRCIIVGGLVIVAVLIGTSWFFTQTEFGQNLLAGACGDCGEGQRTVTVYTADGDIIAQYTGDIEIQNGLDGKVSIVFDGNEYIYYNCSVESAPTLPESDNNKEE